MFGVLPGAVSGLSGYNLTFSRFCQAITLLLYLCTALYPVLYPSVPVICPCHLCGLVLWSDLARCIRPVPVLVAVHPGPVSWSLCAALCGLIPVPDPVPVSVPVPSPVSGP